METPRHHLARGAPLLPGLALALLPKCPLCLALVAGSLGLSASRAGWLPAVGALALGGTWLALARRGTVLERLCGAAGIALLLAGAFLWDAPALPWAGMGLLLAGLGSGPLRRGRCPAALGGTCER